MQRILEPEYMDTTEEARTYAAMDHDAANASVADAFAAAGGRRCARILDIGTGPGDIPILLAARCPDATITALDAAETMLAIARERVAAAGLAARIVLETGDAKRLPFADGAFDGVISNTILHHIPQPVDYLREAGRVLHERDATLVIRDLYRPETRAEAEALVATHAAGAEPRARQLLLDSLCAALTLDEARAAVAAAGLAGATVEMTSDRHYTITLRR